MTIKMTLSREEFKNEMMKIRPDNFSREGLGELFFYFDEMGEENEMEFDPIAICCDFSQCSLDEFLDSYSEVDADKSMDNDEKMVAIKDYIEFAGFWFSFVEDDKEIIFENF